MTEPRSDKIEAAIRSALTQFSSPTIGRGDVHGGQRGWIIYERDGLPFIVAAIASALNAKEKERP